MPDRALILEARGGTDLDRCADRSGRAQTVPAGHRRGRWLDLFCPSQLDRLVGPRGHLSGYLRSCSAYTAVEAKTVPGRGCLSVAATATGRWIVTCMLGDLCRPSGRYALEAMCVGYRRMAAVFGPAG